MALLEVSTQSGIVRGVRANNHGYSIFRGIPYAKPPVGALRYAPPQAVEPWEGILDCDRWPKACMQEQGSFWFFEKEFYPVPKDMSEDCLYLNIWTPAREPGEKLPVFFWIHGGGYGGGYSYEMEFDGEAMCKRGCILVTINYRCNSFGFFAHPELTARFGKSGNAGMYDQIAALKWVHENIAAFGGDPDNITVHGQSAGGMSTKALLASPLCRGLMNRAIIQSAGGLNDWSTFRTMAEQEQFGVKLLETAGLSLDELLALDSQAAFDTLQKAAAKQADNPMQLGFSPCLDGEALVAAPSKCLSDGTINTDSLMCGAVGGDAGLNAQSIGMGAFGQAGDVPPFICCAATLSLARVRAEALKPIYGYEFDHSLPGGDGLGPFHSVELWFMFGSLHRAWRPWTGYDYVLSDTMVDYWCSFARTGDPNTEGRPFWPAYTNEDPRLMFFGDDKIEALDPIQSTEDEALIKKMG